MSELRDSEESWPVLSTTPVYRDQWVMKVDRDEITRPEGGDPFGRLVISHPGAAVAIAVDEDERVLCLRQYRHASKRRMIELPAGVLDQEGEATVDVARRELREEAGYAADEWTQLVTYSSSPGYSTEVIYCYLARGLREIGHGDFVHQHEEADIEIFWAPFDELLDAVFRGDVRNGLTVTCVLAYDAWRRRQERP